MLELKTALLQDENSPKKAFYKLYLLQTEEGYLVRKESGASGKILDCRNWPKPTFQEAEKLFLAKVRCKTNPSRKSPRHYQVTGRQLSLL